MVFNGSHLIAVSSGSQLSEDASLEDTGEVSLSSVPQQVSGMGTFSSWKLTDVSVFRLGSEIIGTLRALWNSPDEQALYGPLFQLLGGFLSTCHVLAAFLPSQWLFLATWLAWLFLWLSGYCLFNPFHNSLATTGMTQGTYFCYK